MLAATNSAAGCRSAARAGRKMVTWQAPIAKMAIFAKADFSAVGFAVVAAIYRLPAQTASASAGAAAASGGALTRAEWHLLLSSLP